MPERHSQIYEVLVNAGVSKSIALYTDELNSQSHALRQFIHTIVHKDDLVSLFSSFPRMEVHAWSISKSARRAKESYLRAITTIEPISSGVLEGVTGGIFSRSFSALRGKDPRLASLEVAVLNFLRASHCFNLLWDFVGVQLPNDNWIEILSSAATEAHLLEWTSRALVHEVRASAKMLQSDKNLSIELAEGLIDQYRRSLKDQPNNWHLWLDLAESLIDINHLGDAEEAIQRTLRLHPSSSRALLLLARVAHKEGRIDDAISNVQHAISLYADLFPAWVELVNLLLESGDRDGALAAYERLVHLEPSNRLVKKLGRLIGR